LPLAKNAGLPARRRQVEVVFADNQGSPHGQNQALRLITKRRSSPHRRLPVGHHADGERDRREIRHSVLNGESVAANLTERGFKWFFRTTRSPPTSRRSTATSSRHEGRAPGPTRWPWSTTTRIRHVGRQRHHQRVQGRRRERPIDIAYAANATDVQSQVLQLKEKKPDV